MLGRQNTNIAVELLAFAFLTRKSIKSLQGQQICRAATKVRTACSRRSAVEHNRVRQATICYGEKCSSCLLLSYRDVGLLDHQSLSCRCLTCLMRTPYRQMTLNWTPSGRGG